MWGFPSADKVNSTEEILNQFGYDSDVIIPEEDIIYLNSLLTEKQNLKSVMQILSNISIISSEDQELLSQIKTLDELKKSNQLSKSVKMLINNISMTSEPQIYGYIREKITMTNGVRHDLRTSASIRNYNAELLFENDPGEQNILDHAVFNFQGKTKSIQWIVGDHQLEGGYGLITWRATPAYKGFETINVITRKGKGLKPYRSSNEYWSTKGLGVQWKTGYGIMMISIGNTFQDGKVENGEINIDETGLHITENDLKVENNLKERSSTILWSNEYLSNQVGIIINNQQVVDLNGSTVSNGSRSVFTSGKWQNWEWFGESAIHNTQYFSFLSGVLYRLDRVKYLITIRSYPHHFRTYRSQPFSEWKGFNDGEMGIFQNVKVKIQKHSFAIYSDIAQKIEEDNHSPYRLIKQEYGIRWKWSNPEHQLTMQFKQKSQTSDEKGFPNNINFSEIKRVTSKWQYQYKINKRVNIRWQINIATFNKNASHGYGLETRIAFKGEHFSSTVIWIISKINDYNSRIYFWGLNLPGEMNSIAVSNNGQQIGTRIQIFKKDNYRVFLRCRVRWSTYALLGTSHKIGALAIQINL